MAKIIDIFSKARKQQEIYNERNKKCLEAAKNRGYCDCKVCSLKTKIALDLILNTLDKCKKYDGENGKVALYGGDVLEILVLAAKKFYDQLENE